MRNLSYNLIPILLKLCRHCDHALKICMWLGYTPQINVCHFLSHLLIAECDIGVQISVRPSVRSFVRPSVRLSTFTSKFGFLDINDSCESETLHSNCP